jgi:hypothetical protein
MAQMIQSWNDIYSNIANGRSYRFNWTKNFNPTTAATASETHVLTRGTGNPGADSLFNTGTNLTFQAVLNSTSGASSIPYGPDVEPTYYRQLLSASAYSVAATTMPAVATLIDVIGFYRVTSVTTTTAQAVTNTLGQTNNITSVTAASDYVDHTAYRLLTGTRVRLTTTTTLPGGLSLATDYYVIRISDTRCSFATSYANAIAGTAINITDAGTGTHTINWLLPRYTNGAGVNATIINSNATPLGAGTPNLSLVYVNQAQTGSKSTPTVLPIGKTAASNTLVLYSGTGSGKYQLAMPFASGDYGISEVTSIQNSTSYVSGEYSVLLYYPLLEVQMPALGIGNTVNCAQDMPSLPRIWDSAALYWSITSSAATPTNSSFNGHLQYVWG